MDCYKSSDPAAVNATLLYDFNSEQGHFWSRSSQDVPLPPCSPSSTPCPDSHCLVCFDQILYAVCRNLTDGVKMTMEAGGTQVKISKSECPKPSSGGPLQSTTIISILLPLLLFLLMVALVIYWKCCRKPATIRGEEVEMQEEEESEIHAVRPVEETDPLTY